MFKDRNSRTKINIFVHTSYFYEYIIYDDPNIIKSLMIKRFSRRFCNKFNLGYFYRRIS